MNKKFASTIAGASILITGIGLISRGFGFIREVVYANNFGLQTNFDVYLIGAVIPITLNTTIFYLAQNYFIPIYHKKLAEGKDEARRFFYDSFSLFLLISFLLSIILLISSSFLIEVYLSKDNPQLYNLALSVFRIFLVTIPFNAGFSIIASYSQAEFNFKSPAISALFQNIIIIALVLIFTDSIGVYTIPVGYVLGTLAQFIYLLIIIRKDGINLFSKLSLNFKIFTVFHNILFMTIVVEIIGQLFILIDRYFYVDVEQGGIAALNYASVLYTLPIAIFSLALSTAIFPKISQAINQKNNSLLQMYFSYGIKINLFLFIPITLIIIFFGNEIITLLYQRGEFSFNDSQMTFNILKIYAFSLIFYTSYAIINKIIYGAGLIKYLLTISFVIFFLKIILNVLMVGNFKQDGLAASTTICFSLLSILSYGLIVKKLKLKNSVEFFKTIIFYLFNGFFSMAVFWISQPYLQLNFYFNFFTALIIFISVYSINILLLKPKEYFIFKDTFFKALKG